MTTKNHFTLIESIFVFLLAFSLFFALSSISVHADPWDPNDWPCGIGALPPCNFTPNNHSVAGNPEEVPTLGVEELVLSIGGDELGADNVEFTGVQEVQFMDESAPIVSFDYNFSNSSLNLSGVRIHRQTDRYGYTIISNLNISTTKSLYIPKISRINKVCVKDADINSIDDITKDCTGSDETLFEPCSVGGTKIGNLTCTLYDTYYQVDNLTHSGGYEAPPETKTGYYTVEYLTRGDNFKEGYLHDDDIVQICFASADDIFEDEFLRISLIPSDGYPTYLEFTTPYVFSTERIYLYP